MQATLRSLHEAFLTSARTTNDDSDELRLLCPGVEGMQIFLSGVLDEQK